ncbi:hypothetical protein O6P43_001073 [Quillaja saponaria]|uniref:Uncharacterized protein n=1 Tax=Quillaja saponaria TaxID=32244 RepID=A0AAD7QHZ9_QUISA|nr:hypothetical protein O6P43_001073 [Quillaja saponaria]
MSLFVSFCLTQFRTSVFESKEREFVCRAKMGFMILRFKVAFLLGFLVLKSFNEFVGSNAQSLLPEDEGILQLAYFSNICFWV